MSRPGALGHPLSYACRQGDCDVCQGFSGGYDTYLCGCRHHWCSRGEHKRGQCDCQAPRSTSTGAPAT